MYYKEMSPRLDSAIIINYYSKKQVWSRYGQSIDQHYIFTINRCNFCKQEYHPFPNCLFIERDVQDAMINHFRIQAQNHQNSRDDHNLLVNR
jgi:hypothetical protein